MPKTLFSRPKSFCESCSAPAQPAESKEESVRYKQASAHDAPPEVEPAFSRLRLAGNLSALGARDRLLPAPDGRREQCFPKGLQGDQLNLMLAAAAWKFRKQVRLFALFGVISHACSLPKTSISVAKNYLRIFRVRLPLSALILWTFQIAQSWGFVGVLSPVAKPAADLPHR
jgi:hypothetical protein